MIPAVNENFTQPFETLEIPSKDFAYNSGGKRISGTVEGIEAVAQAVYIILNTERYDYIIYSWDYGVEFSDLIGQPVSYVVPEAERRIKEALLQDERIKDVYDFEFEKNKRSLHVTFRVSTEYGIIESGVNINV